MALKKQKLVDGLKEAFDKAKEVEESTKKVDGKDVKVSDPKHSQDAIAGFIADAVVSYASDAEITISAPFTIPTTPSPSPDFSVVRKKLKVQTAQVGKAALKNAIITSMNSQDQAASAITSGIVAYAAASFTAFAAGAVTGAGAAVMAVPPVLVSPLAFGRGTPESQGGSEDEVIDLIASIIHASFLGTKFTGAGANAGIPIPSATAPPPAGSGPVVSTLS